MAMMPQAGAEITTRATRAFVVLNPKSGQGAADEARQALERQLGSAGVACRFHEPKKGESLADRVREAIASGCDLVIAAGGDGTVSAVADALAGTETPLGIVPLGTANVLAGELGIPLELDASVALLAEAHTLTRIDAMELGGKHYVTQVGIGLDAAMIRDTPGTHKRRFGRVAYVWTALTRLIGLRSHRFTLTVDGSTTRPRATQVLIANSGTLGSRPFRWGEDIRPDDGRLDVCVIHARTLLGFLTLGWHFLRGQHRRSASATYLCASRDVTIATRRPMPVQADGEIVGKTPVTVTVAAGAVKVVVPVSKTA